MSGMAIESKVPLLACPAVLEGEGQSSGITAPKNLKREFHGANPAESPSAIDSGSLISYISRDI